MKAKRYGSDTKLSNVIYFLRRFGWLHVTVFAVVTVSAFSGKTGTVGHRRNKKSPSVQVQQQQQQPSLHTKLQNCFTPTSILENIAVLVTPKVDPSASLSSLALIRLSKQIIALDNENNEYLINDNNKQLWKEGLRNLVSCLASSNWKASPKSLETAVEGVKAASVISRLMSSDYLISSNNDNNNGKVWWEPLVEKLHEEADDQLVRMIQPHQLSGIKFSIDCIQLSSSTKEDASDLLSSHQQQYLLPQSLQIAYDNLNLPFSVRPGFLNGNDDDDDDVDNKHNNNLFTVASFVKQVNFQIETIQTATNRTVAERRQTAWEGDEHVENFEYSEKSMRRLPWSDVVANVRDRLYNETSHYYDGCLLNFYPDGDSAMRYHIDPDQGVLWDYETAVVSIGATRRFSFRESSSGNGSNKPHVFVLMNGDVTEMFNDCQERFQHTVQKSSVKGESASRVSLVFKKTLGYSKERTKSRTKV